MITLNPAARRTLTLLSSLGIMVPAHGLQALQDPAPAMRQVAGLEGTTLSHGTVSPDGRWVVFSAWEAQTGPSALWIAPLSGGEPRRLLAEARGDRAAAFAPGGDRIFFISQRVSRNGDDEQFLVSVGFDSDAGRAVGDVRQVGLAPALAMIAPQVAPDGRWVSYMSGDELRIVPASGGSERVLAVIERPLQSGLQSLSWTPDSRALTYARRQVGARDQTRVRLDITGGGPVETERGPRVMGVLLPDGVHLVRTRQDGQPRDRRLIIARRDNDAVVADLPFPDLAFMSLSIDGRYITAGRRDQVASLRLASADGGSREVAPDRGAYTWPMGWTADGHLVYEAENRALRTVDLRGNAGPTFSLPDPQSQSVLAVHGNYALVQETIRADRSIRRLLLLELSTGRTRTVSEAALPGSAARGAGGNYSRDDSRFVFAERDAQGIHLQSVGTDGSIRSIRRVSAEAFQQTQHAVHGVRLAWFERTPADGVWLMISDGPDAEPRRVAQMPEQRTNFELAWSHDARTIVASEGASKLHLIDLNAPANARLRTLELPFEYFYEPLWLRDRDAITVVAQPKDTPSTHIVRIDLGTGRTTNVTADDPAPKWGHLTSPDGRMISYPSETTIGGSVWVLDLHPLLAGTQR